MDKLKTWVIAVNGIREPKISWLERQLNAEGIGTQRKTGLRGPQIYVTFEDAGHALDIVYRPIGQINIESDERNVTWMDLPYDHPIFTSDDNQLFGGRVPRITAGADAQFADRPTPIDLVNAVLPIHRLELWADSIMAITPFYVAEDKALWFRVGDSSSVTMIGIELVPNAELPAAYNGDSQWRVYAKFVAGSHTYRYRPVSREVIADLLIEIFNSNVGLADASVGKLFHQTVKIPANNSETMCEKFHEGRWMHVIPRAKKQ